MRPWKERIAEAKERGAFTTSDLILAAGWGKCAVGEHQGQFKRMVNDERSSPEDDTLTRLGCFFYDAVYRNEIGRATELYNDIQAWFKEREPVILYPMVMDEVATPNAVLR